MYNFYYEAGWSATFWLLAFGSQADYRETSLKLIMRNFRCFTGLHQISQ